ncbi:MAG: iron-containing alcohol dehydrogenase [Kiritimatiellae bacterium]|nr:iron-containing alcohol dehydrogenase [Kiritimatiellia bacterium]
MTDFDYWSPTYIAFGKDKESRTGELVRRFGGRKALMIYGGGSAVRSGLIGRVEASLSKAGVGFIKLGGVKPNPRSSLVEEGVRLALSEKVDFMLAVGGGSVIDTAKAIAIGAANGGEWRRFYVGKEVKVRPAIPAALPVGVVLTIAAAGSEGSTNSIINLEPENLKRGAGGDILRPKFAVLNPELTMSLPPFQTACGLADMFAHLCERYFTPTADVTLSDNLCEAVMRTVVDESAKIMANPTDYQARANVMWAGTLAHNDICGAGRVQDWASHGIEHELSALYDCAHGAGLAVVMPAWMTYVHDANDARFARFARNVFGVGQGEPDAAAALAGIRAFRRWLKSLGLPLTFAELGAKEEDIPTLLRTLNLSGNTLGGFKPLAEKDVEAIYRLCLNSDGPY